MIFWNSPNGKSNQQASTILDEIDLSSRKDDPAETAKLFNKLPPSFDDKKSSMRAAQLHRRLALNFYSAGGDREKPMSDHLAQASMFASRVLTGKELAAYMAEIADDIMKKGMPVLALPLLLDAVKIYECAEMHVSFDSAMAKYNLGLSLTLVP